jgi:esterase/lipase
MVRVCYPCLPPRSSRWSSSRRPAVLAAPTDRVLLVHGYRGDPSNWADMKSFLEAHGRTVAAIDLPVKESEPP